MNKDAQASYNPKVSDEFQKDCLKVEQYREYFHGGRWHKIDFPVLLVRRKGGTTHRVVDWSGLVHVFPNDCPLRWKDHDISEPVKF